MKWESQNNIHRFIGVLVLPFLFLVDRAEGTSTLYNLYLVFGILQVANLII